MIKLKIRKHQGAQKTLLTSVFVLRDKLEASLGVYLLFDLLFYWGFLFGLIYLIVTKKTILIIVILFLLYLWAELAVGIFFQDSWGGS